MWPILIHTKPNVSATFVVSCYQRTVLHKIPLFQPSTKHHRNTITDDTTASPQPECGNRPVTQSQSRIVGGFNARYGAYPWQAGIQKRGWLGGYSHHCGATIIDDNWVMSAAHCFQWVLKLLTPDSMRPVYLYMRHWTGSSVVDVMAWCRIGTSPLHEPMMPRFYQMYTSDQSVDSFLPHDDVIKWKHFPRYWLFVRGIHRSPVNSTHKGQWRGALMFTLICSWMNGWVNNRVAGDLRRYRAHHDVTVMRTIPECVINLHHLRFNQCLVR